MKRNLVILIVLLIFAPCACLGVLGLLLKAIGRTAVTGQSETPEYKYGEEWRFGDLGVTVTAGIHDWTSTTAAGRAMTHDLNFVVTIKFKSYNPNRELSAGSQCDSSSLTDDVGNTYLVIYPVNEIGIHNRVDGQIRAGMSRNVRSDNNDAGDVLVFGKPLPGASSVTLTFDAKKYGGKGKIVVTIPRSKWK
jgi:hypothetical protein